MAGGSFGLYRAREIWYETACSSRVTSLPAGTNTFPVPQMNLDLSHHGNAKRRRRTFALLALALDHLAKRLGELLSRGRDSFPVLEARGIMHSLGGKEVAEVLELYGSSWE